MQSTVSDISKMHSGSPELIIWTANYEQLNGQAIVTKKSVEALSNCFKICIYSYVPGIIGLKSLVVLYIKLFASVLLRRKQVNMAYMVPSRSVPGFIRDIPFLIYVKLVGISVVVHLHGNDLHMIEKPIINKLFGWLYRGCTFITCANAISIPTCLKITKLFKIDNFVSPHRLIEAELLRDYKLAQRNGGSVRCTFISNLHYTKGFLKLCHAVRSCNLSLASHQIDLKIYGKPAADDIMNTREVSVLVGSIKRDQPEIFFGVIEDDELYRNVMLHTDIFCLPTEYKTELAPLAIIEAMCNGVIIVVTDRPVIRELIGDYPFVVFSKSDASDLSCALLAALSINVVNRTDIIKKYRKKYDVNTFNNSLIYAMKSL